MFCLGEDPSVDEASLVSSYITVFKEGSSCIKMLKWETDVASFIHTSQHAPRYTS